MLIIKQLNCKNVKKHKKNLANEPAFLSGVQWSVALTFDFVINKRSHHGNSIQHLAPLHQPGRSKPKQQPLFQRHYYRYHRRIITISRVHVRPQE